MERKIVATSMKGKIFISLVLLLTVLALYQEGRRQDEHSNRHQDEYSNCHQDKRSNRHQTEHNNCSTRKKSKLSSKAEHKSPRAVGKWRKNDRFVSALSGVSKDGLDDILYSLFETSRESLIAQSNSQEVANDESMQDHAC